MLPLAPGLGSTTTCWTHAASLSRPDARGYPRRRLRRSRRPCGCCGPETPARRRPPAGGRAPAQAPCDGASRLLDRRPGRRLKRRRTGLQRHPPHVARICLVLIRSAAMHRGAVVPDDEVADLPAVPETNRLGRELRQFADQRQGLRCLPAFDAADVGGQIEREPARARVSATRRCRTGVQRSTSSG